MGREDGAVAPRLGGSRQCRLPRVDRLGSWHCCPLCPPTTKEGVPRGGPGPFSEVLLEGGDKKTDRGEGALTWWGPSGLPLGCPGACTICGQVLAHRGLCSSSRGLVRLL